MNNETFRKAQAELDSFNTVIVRAVMGGDTITDRDRDRYAELVERVRIENEAAKARFTAATE